MNLENKLLVSITAGFLNMLLSITIPCLIKNIKKPFIVKIKTVFNNNKKLILTSSILISVLVFLALSITDELSDMFDNNNNNSSEIFYSQDSRVILESTDYDLPKSNRMVDYDLPKSNQMFIEPGTELPRPSQTNNSFGSNNTLSQFLSNMSEVKPINNLPELKPTNTLEPMLSTNNLSEVLPTSNTNLPATSSKDIVNTLQNMLDPSRVGAEMANAQVNPSAMTNSVLPSGENYARYQ